MAKNNHFNDNRGTLDRLLRTSLPPDDNNRLAELINYAHTLVSLENTLVVISDMHRGESRIVIGDFGLRLGLDGYEKENSIWESRILEMMTPKEQENKFIAELRFYHFIRHLHKSKRKHYYLASILRFILKDGSNMNVMHRMYYVYNNKQERVLYAVCLYSPMAFAMKWRNQAVNSLTGEAVELAETTNASILGPRECQVLSLIDQGLKSAEIAARLNISVHTVSRHRQEILAKLQVKNSIEACRLATRMGLI